MQPFVAQAPAAVLDDLRARLAHTRWPTPPRAYVEQGFNVRRWTPMPAGGHFAALEQPVLLAEDLKVFFATLT